MPTRAVVNTEYGTRPVVLSAKSSRRHSQPPHTRVYRWLVADAAMPPITPMRNK